MLMNEMLNAAEQLNLLKLIYDNTWRAINQQAGTGYSEPKRNVSRTVSRPAAARKHKAKHRKSTKPVTVPVQPLPKAQAQPQVIKTKPKPFNTPKGLSYLQRVAQPANRASDSQSQNSVNSLDLKPMGKVGIATRNTNAD